MPLVQSPAAVETRPIALPLLTLRQVVNNSSASGNPRLPIVPPAVSERQNVVRRTIGPGLPPSLQSVPATPSRTPAVDRAVWLSIAQRAAGDLAWLWRAANNSDNSDQQRKKDAPILALDAVFAQYGQ
jgi:hypothetical protein